MHFIKSFIIIVLTTCGIARCMNLMSTPIVRVKSGELRGVISMDALQGTYYSYFGIPYARVEDRFQAGKPVSWDGVFDATDDTTKCTQRNWLATFFKSDLFSVCGQEDCLILNVYTPAPQLRQSARLTSLKPVMVFIHGGGFRAGSSSSVLYGPQYLISHDVIVVAINYRVEVLGFLCLGIKEAPGNVGLKDQVAALKWVKENIDQFGGDPDKITIFGESAGSASVMYHLISPMSKGIFNKAIMQSGSAASPWSFQFEPLKAASQLAQQMGFETEDPYELYNIFMNKTAAELLLTRVPRTKGDIVQSETIFTPCAEKEIPDVEAFITDHPYNLIVNEQYAKVPMIIGYNDHEGYLFAGKENDTTIENLDFFHSLPRDLKFPSEEEATKTAEKFKDLYMGNKKVSKDTLKEWSDFEGDSGIIYPVTATADKIVRSNDNLTFLYKFAYSGVLNLMKMESGFGSAPGASHADDIFYLFKPMLSTVGGLLEADIIHKMTTMWTNFAKFGDPTPEGSTGPSLPQWTPADRDRPSFLVIDRQFSTGPLWDSDRLQFWNETYALYRRKE